jgi:hypothetical protein
MSIVLPDPRFEMPELLLPGRKPTGPVEIDWTNPITHGLTDYTLLGANYRRPWDYAVKRFRTPGIQGTHSVVQGGVQLDQSVDLSSFYGLGFGFGTFGTNSQYTVAIMITRNSGTSDFLWARYEDGGNTNQKQLVYSGAGFRSRQDTTTGASIIDFGDASTAQCLIVTIDTDNGYHRCYQDGVLAGELAVTGTPDNTDGQFYIGSRYSLTNNNTTETIIQGLIGWDRALTVAEACEASADPYHLLIPK